MDQQAQYDLGNVDLTKVDCDVTPQTVDEYLQQVAAGRMRIPEVAFVDRPKEPKQDVQKMVKGVDPLARKKEWQQQKVRFYRENREQLAQLRAVTAPLDVDWPSIYSPREWVTMILKKPQAMISEEIRDLFPQHEGIPPTPEVLFSMTNAQVENLIQTLQWIYAVLLILEKNYLHDVLASLRDLANFCRKGRSALAETELDEREQEEMAQMYSLFISIVALYFEQKDLAD
ncbi:unnamed protein product, partial [Mesorhabditis belari]|uniref:Gem-associated protein 2 n=1 Tax=Mesorhabditis belari TaxID=2138241 RepID=A0AAF3EG06_9BILA